jgi:hypothetical protein
MRVLFADFADWGWSWIDIPRAHFLHPIVSELDQAAVIFVNLALALIFVDLALAFLWGGLQSCLGNYFGHWRRG